MSRSENNETPHIPFGPEDTPWQDAFSDLDMIDASPPVSAPTGNPRASYTVIPEVPYSQVQLSPAGMSSAEYRDAEDAFRQYIDTQSGQSIGYQMTVELDYEKRLSHYLGRIMNNVGDPFQSGAFTPNSKILERAVLDYYASLWNAKWPHDPQDPDTYWGYLLTMGATEGNLYGLWNGRECLSGQLLLKDQYDPTLSAFADEEQAAHEPDRVPSARDENAFTPVAFFSEDTHYSITKALQVLTIETFHDIGTARYPDENPLDPGSPWPTAVPSIGGADGIGEIDVDKLAVLVEFFAGRGFPILVNLNYGSTFKGAYDDVEAVSRTVREICERHGLGDHRTTAERADGVAFGDRPGYWIHLDAALGAAFAPFMHMARDAGYVSTAPPAFDFRLPGVHSLTMSGHKWIGAPWPCGVFMTRTGLRIAPPRTSEYIGSADTTFAGSRNGFSALLMWDFLAHHSYDDQIRAAVETTRIAAYAHERLLALQEKLGTDLWVSRSPESLTVRFRRPNPELVRRYSLSYETVAVDGESRPYCHLFAMRHVSENLIDSLIKDLEQPGSFSGIAGEVPA